MLTTAELPVAPVVALCILFEPRLTPCAVTLPQCSKRRAAALDPCLHRAMAVAHVRRAAVWISGVTHEVHTAMLAALPRHVPAALFIFRHALHHGVTFAGVLESAVPNALRLDAHLPRFHVRVVPRLIPDAGAFRLGAQPGIGVPFAVHLRDALFQLTHALTVCDGCRHLQLHFLPELGVAAEVGELQLAEWRVGNTVIDSSLNGLCVNTHKCGLQPELLTALCDDLDLFKPTVTVLGA